MRWKSLFFSATTLVLAVASPGTEPIVLLPAEFQLRGPAARQQLVVDKSDGAQLVGEVSNEAAFESSDSQVVKIENCVALPVADGTATITAQRGDQRATAAVTVSGAAKAPEVSFRNHIQPILAKTGCSLGACHGAAAGQGGFKLSLRGYDDEGDYLALTRAALGRRITPVDPARSLFLLKPTNVVPHKGGE